MNTVKISELPAASSLSSDDAIPIVQGGTTKKATLGSLSGALVDVDEAISSTSDKPVQNKAIKTYVDSKTAEAKAYTDTAVSGVTVTCDSALSSTSENPVKNKVIKSYVDSAVSGKENTLSFSAPLSKSGSAVSLSYNAPLKKSGNNLALDIDSNLQISGGKLKIPNFSSTAGAQAGVNASTENGGAIGNTAKSINGGAVGAGSTTHSGFAGGHLASSSYGGAVGYSAITSDGFAGGKNAKCQSGNNAIDAIQLGTGTNATAGTMQVYGYQMMDANGKIPYDRLPNALQVCVIPFDFYNAFESAGANFIIAYPYVGYAYMKLTCRKANGTTQYEGDHNHMNNIMHLRDGMQYVEWDGSETYSVTGVYSDSSISNREFYLTLLDGGHSIYLWAADEQTYKKDFSFSFEGWIKITT